MAPICELPFDDGELVVVVVELPVGMNAVGDVTRKKSKYSEPACNAVSVSV
jgi:hypothetical protein